MANNFLGQYSFTATAQCEDQANFSTSFSRTFTYNASTGILTVRSTASKTSGQNYIRPGAMGIWLVYID